MKFKFLYTILLSVISYTSFAQTLKGFVFDASTNSALSGATVTIPGKVLATSDKNGEFSISCSNGLKITISYVGFQSSTQLITSCDQGLQIGLARSNSNLNNIEITASSNQNKSLLYQPNSITKLESVELKRGTGLFLDDAINGNVPGVTMNRRAVSSGQQINIRGYGNGSRGTRGISSNFDGQGYKVYLNGIPVTDAEGITVMDDLDFGSIGNVEVTKGPSGTLYGLAIAGVINLHTIKPEKGRTSIGQEVILGNYGLERYNTQLQIGADRSYLMVNYGHQKSDGFTIHNASRKDFVNLAGDFQPNEKQSLNVYAGYSNSYDERSGELTIQQFGANDFSGNIEYIKRNAHSAVYTVRGGVNHTYKFNDKFANTSTIFGTGFNSNASSAGGWTDKASSNFGLRSTFDTKFSIGKDITLSGLTGIETQRQNASTVGYGMAKDPRDLTSVWAVGNPYYYIITAATSNVYTTTATTSLFSEWTLALPHDLLFVAGVGLSNMKINLDDRFYVAGKPTKYDTTYKDMFSPHIALNKVFNKQFSLYASYNRAYKAPVSSYFFIPYAVGQAQSGIVNSNLKAEKGDQFEVGSKGAFMNGRVNYQLAFFSAQFKNKLTTTAVPYNSTTTLFSYVTNGGEQTNNGIEALLKYTAYQSTTGFFKSITPFTNLAYSDFKYGNYPYHLVVANKDSVINYKGNDVAGVSKIVANVGVDIYTKPGFYANANYLYRDPMPITSDGLNRTTSYSLLNAKLGYQHSISKHFELNVYAGANNITGTKYPIMIFVNQLPDAYVAGPHDANYFGGVNIKYIF